MKLAVIAVFLTGLLTVVLASAFGGGEKTPEQPTLAEMPLDDFLHLLGPSEDVFEGCLPIGSSAPDDRTAVYLKEAPADDKFGGALIFVCYTQAPGLAG